jgi:hypothetical protein
VPRRPAVSRFPRWFALKMGAGPGGVAGRQGVVCVCVCGCGWVGGCVCVWVVACDGGGEAVASASIKERQTKGGGNKGDERRGGRWAPPPRSPESGAPGGLAPGARGLALGRSPDTTGNRVRRFAIREQRTANNLGLEQSAVIAISNPTHNTVHLRSEI